MKKFSVKTIAAAGIGAILFFIIGRFVVIPSGISNTNISIQYGELAFIAAVFGPIAGLLAGFIGHFFIDFSYGWGVWWSWVITSAFFGGLVGAASRELKIDEGEFAVKDIIYFNSVQIVSHLLAWAVLAPVLDIVIYQESSDKVFTQGLVSAGINILATAIAGTLFCIVYAKVKSKQSSSKGM